MDLGRWGNYHAIYEFGIQRGKRINSISMEAEGWLMCRCMSIVDDFLIFPACPEECRIAAAPRRDKLSNKFVEKWLDEAEKVGLIARYEAEGDIYAVFIKAPPKRTPNGKLAKRFPHPPPQVAVWNIDKLMWFLGGTKKSRLTKESRSPKPTTLPYSIPIQPPPTPPNTNGGGGGNSDGDKKASPEAVLMGLLSRCRVPAAKISEILAVQASIPPLSVVAAWAAVKSDPKVNSVGPVLAHRLINGKLDDPITMSALCAAIRAGIVYQINGEDISTVKITYSELGLKKDGKLWIKGGDFQKVAIQ